jgi:hypothetical protein
LEAQVLQHGNDLQDEEHKLEVLHKAAQEIGWAPVLTSAAHSELFAKSLAALKVSSGHITHLLFPDLQFLYSKEIALFQKFKSASVCVGSGIASRC